MKAPKTPPLLLTASQVGERLGLSEKHVRRLMQAGEIRVTRLGRRAARVAEDDLGRFIESKR